MAVEQLEDEESEPLNALPDSTPTEDGLELLALLVSRDNPSEHQPLYPRSADAKMQAISHLAVQRRGRLRDTVKNRASIRP